MANSNVGSGDERFFTWRSGKSPGAGGSGVLLCNVICFSSPMGNVRVLSTNADFMNDEEETALAEVEEANFRSRGHIQMKKKPDNQWGVFSSRTHAKGTIVISSQPVRDEFSPTPGVPNPKSTSCSHAIQISWNEHMMMDLPARFLNHSCDPNVGVGNELNEWGSYDFVALRDIAAGEEIRFDYETTEHEIGAFSECHCGASTCRGHVHGFKLSGDAIYKKYGGKNIAKYLLENRA